MFCPPCEFLFWLPTFFRTESAYSLLKGSLCLLPRLRDSKSITESLFGIFLSKFLIICKISWSVS
jgi:hypothetical protein